MLKVAGDVGVHWMTNLCNSAEGHIPEDWKRSILLQLFKGKGDPLVCGSYRATWNESAGEGIGEENEDAGRDR